jgi:hypothetical protein
MAAIAIGRLVAPAMPAATGRRVSPERGEACVTAAGGNAEASTASGVVGAGGSAGMANEPVVSGAPPSPWANAAAPATAPARRIAANTRPMPLMFYPLAADNITQKRYRRMGIRP